MSGKLGSSGTKSKSNASDKNLESVTLSVIEARNLAAMDRGGTSDPYVKISSNFGKQAFKTKVIPKTLSPIWNQEYTFLECPPTGSLMLKVWDKDWWMRDDFLGEIEVKLDRFQPGKPIDFWEKLTKEPKKKKGQRTSRDSFEDRYSSERSERSNRSKKVY
jgi:Ca2+-dependent lipid-binding protein